MLRPIRLHTYLLSGSLMWKISRKDITLYSMQSNISFRKIPYFSRINHFVTQRCVIFNCATEGRCQLRALFSVGKDERTGTRHW